MAGFPKQERQKIIDGYLARTGRNMFVPGEFIDWLELNPDHVAHSWFFEKDDEELAREHRIGMVRGMISGLRIVKREAIEDGKGRTVSVTVSEYPAFISPLSGRRSGGGYEPFDSTDAAQVEELRRQGIISLKTWLNRYSGVFKEEQMAIHGIVERYEASEAEFVDGETGD